MKFKSLKMQIIVVFLTLIIGIQLAGLIPIQYSINRNAQNTAEQDLIVGERVFLNILEHNTNSLKQGAKILAADYGFRESIATNDQETIISALNNHQSRINADIAIFYSANQSKLILSGEVSSDEANVVVQRLINEYSAENNHSDFEIFNDTPYQLVAVPIKAPLVIGWVVMGFKIDDFLVKKLHKLSNLQVTFLQKTQNQIWRSTASSLSDKHVGALVKEVSQYYTPQFKKTEIQIADAVYDSRILTLHADKNTLITVLQQSISETKAQYDPLKLSLMLLTLAGLSVFTVVIIYTSKLITKPITELSETAKQLGQGNFDLTIKTDRKDEIGELSNAFNSMREAISDREKRIYRAAFVDEITELPNRAAFIKCLDENIAAAKETDSNFSVMILNLDRFKQINKIMGRAFADQILIHVAESIYKFVSQTTDTVARLGADEFAVLLANTQLEQAQLVVNKMLKQFEQTQQVYGQNIDISMSVGISEYPIHGDSHEQLFNNAETALQYAKAKKVAVVVYEKQIDIGTKENLTLASDLREAIKNNQLSLYLQPKVDITSRQATTAEALVRWIHPEKGFIFPDQFIPFAEQTGLIQNITLWMLNEACKVVAELKDKGIMLTIAVNISTRDLIDQALPEKLQALLNQHQISVENIAIEITESSIMDDPVRAESTLLKLAQMGIKIAIDDFGTGYSSLAYLKRLPVQELKIDKSFVLNMEKNDSDATIVKSTIDLGHNLKLKVVAEGIENVEAWKLLAKMGCDYGQGYFMGKPMPAKDYPAWLAKWLDKANSDF
jgi:diguanylate cyclase